MVVRIWEVTVIARPFGESGSNVIDGACYVASCKIRGVGCFRYFSVSFFCFFWSQCNFYNSRYVTRKSEMLLDYDFLLILQNVKGAYRVRCGTKIENLLKKLTLWVSRRRCFVLNMLYDLFPKPVMCVRYMMWRISYIKIKEIMKNRVKYM